MPSPAISRRDWIIAGLVSMLIVTIAVVPILNGYATQPAGLRFGGFVLNALDGNSSLAKMEIGRRGAWSFHLPYTAEPGPGVPIYLFYIFLGHVAGWTSASSILVFHVARSVASLIFLFTLFAFCARFFEGAGPRWTAWLLISIGSGLGWLFISSGIRTADLWVADAISFLSILSNPHFPLGAALALVLYLLLIPGLNTSPALDGPRGAAIIFSASALAIVQVFGVITVCAVVSATYLVTWLRASRQPNTTIEPSSSILTRLPFLRLVLFLAAAVPWLLYDYWLAQNQPALRAWSAQNVTPSPPLWDYAIAFSPALIAALAGAWHASRRGSALDIFLLTWFGVNAILLYAPLAVQRRLSQGISVPIGLLAVQGIYYMLAPKPGWRRMLTFATFSVLALPSNLLVLLATLIGLGRQGEDNYLTASEAQALAWIDTNTPANALVLASPQLGLFIPAHTARRVVYGHPFETVNAQQEAEAVTAYYAELSPAEAADFVRIRGVNYVIYGPREAALGPDPAGPELTPVFVDGDLTIFQALP